MVTAANEYRRSRCQPPMTIEEIRRRVGREQLAMLADGHGELLAHAR